jgi:hypothetical protein
MKRILFIVMIVLTGLTTTAVLAQTKEEARLDKDASAIDKEAGTPQGEQVVVQRLEKEFNVDEARISGLRTQKLGYGEIAIVLAIASQKMTGGITDANIKTIMTMREGPPKEGWGEIAKKLGFKLGPTISSVEKLEKAAHNDMEKAEKMEKPERMEKSERPERPERMGH